MKIQRTSFLLLAAGILSGIGGAIGLQVYAQQAPAIAAPSVIQAEKTLPVIDASTTVKADTDNLQDPGGKEQADVPEQTKSDTDNIQDPGGVEVPDATSTVSDEGAHQGNAQDKVEKEDGANDKGGADGEAAGE